MSNILQLKNELRRTADQALDADRRGDIAAAEQLLTKTDILLGELAKAERQQAIAGIGGVETMTMDSGPSLATALIDAGWNRKTRPSVVVDQSHALGVRLKAGSFDGGSDIEDAVPSRFTAPELGLDARYIYPHLAGQGVAADQTGVQSYRQKSRSLASPSDMVRAIDETSTKPETDSTSEAVAVALKQIATVSTGTPNILLLNQSFRAWVNNDLTGAYRAAVDYHIVTEIGNAGIGSGGGGSNVYEDVLFSQEVVRAAGYQPNIVVVSPADALAIQLLLLTNGDHYVFATPAPALVVSPSVEDGAGFVADAAALGVLFLGPFQLATFEENSGTSNTSTARAESNGLFLVQRPDAAAMLAAS